MPTLWNVEPAIAFKLDEPASEVGGKHRKNARQKRGDMLTRLGMARIGLWRVQNDLYALRTVLARVDSKIARTESHEANYDALVVYKTNLETRAADMERVVARIEKIIQRRAVDSLSKPEAMWFAHMRPCYREADVPPHLEYWLGSTAKSPVLYQRITGPARDRHNGHLLWQLDLQTYAPKHRDMLPGNGVHYTKGYSYTPLCNLLDVELELFGKPISYLG